MSTMAKGKSAPRMDYRQRVSDTLAQTIEEHGGMPWRVDGNASDIRPFNPSNGVKYKGGNVVSLLVAQLERSSSDPRWMTMNQANKAGYSIRKGAKATYVEYWDFGPPLLVPAEGGVPKAAEVAQEASSPSRRAKLFYVQLFNGNDVVGLPPLKRDVSWSPNELAEKLIAATGAKIRHVDTVDVHGRKVFYSHDADEIVLAPRAAFKSDRAYYNAAFVGLSQWTGHTSRLARANADQGKGFNTPGFAKEVLRAELAALNITSLLGVRGHDANDGKLASSWGDVLKKDKHEVFRAARDADLILEKLFESAPELRTTVESRLTNNLLPKEPARRKIASGIIEGLPNFIPVGVTVGQPVAAKAAGVGRDDTRWVVFEGRLREEAAKLGVADEAIEEAMDLLERQFTDFMNAGLQNGFDSEDMSAMLSRNIVGEVRLMERRQEQWGRFCDQVKAVGASVYTPETMDLALHELSMKYRQVITQGARDNWAPERTTNTILNVIFGEEGERKVTADYVQRLVNGSEKVKSLIASMEEEVTLSPLGGQQSLLDDTTLDDDELVLMPLGGEGDMGEVSDERISKDGRFLMEDAEICEPC